MYFIISAKWQISWKWGSLFPPWSHPMIRMRLTWRIERTFGKAYHVARVMAHEIYEHCASNKLKAEMHSSRQFWLFWSFSWPCRFENWLKEVLARLILSNRKCHPIEKQRLSSDDFRVLIQNGLFRQRSLKSNCLRKERWTRWAVTNDKIDLNSISFWSSDIQMMRSASSRKSMLFT